MRALGVLHRFTRVVKQHTTIWTRYSIGHEFRFLPLRADLETLASDINFPLNRSTSQAAAKRGCKGGEPGEGGPRGDPPAWSFTWGRARRFETRLPRSCSIRSGRETDTGTLRAPGHRSVPDEGKLSEGVGGGTAHRGGVRHGQTRSPPTALLRGLPPGREEFSGNRAKAYDPAPFPGRGPTSGTGARVERCPRAPLQPRRSGCVPRRVRHDYPAGSAGRWGPSVAPLVARRPCSPSCTSVGGVAGWPRTCPGRGRTERGRGGPWTGRNARSCDRRFRNLPPPGPNPARTPVRALGRSPSGGVSPSVAVPLRDLPPAPEDGGHASASWECHWISWR